MKIHPANVQECSILICDYTGKVIGKNESNTTYSFGDARNFTKTEKEFCKKYKIRPEGFLSQPYHFYKKTEQDNMFYVEMHLMGSVATESMYKKSRWYKCFTFEEALRASRIITTKRLLETKEITVDQLIH